MNEKGEITSMYKIGEAARLMGVSTEALRYYERKGLVTPRKDHESKYRYFDSSQINHLLNMQRYQKFGFSLYEIVDIFHNCDADQFASFMKVKEQELMRESLMMNMRIYSIHQSMEHMKLAKKAKAGILFGERPAMYRLSYMKNDEIIASSKLDQEMRRWSSCSDLQFVSAFMKEEDVEKQVDFHEFGIGMYQDIAEFMDVSENEVITYYEACPALVCCFESTDTNSILDCIGKVNVFLKEHDLRLAGDLLTQVLYSRCEESHFQMQHLLWIPYSEN